VDSDRACPWTREILAQLHEDRPCDQPGTGGTEPQRPPAQWPYNTHTPTFDPMTEVWISGNVLVTSTKLSRVMLIL